MHATSATNVAVALQVSINFLKPAVEGDTLTAEATRVSEGRTTGLYHVTVKSRDETSGFLLRHSLQKIT